MLLFVKIFCQPQRKRAIENKPAFGALNKKPTPHRILDISKI